MTPEERKEWNERHGYTPDDPRYLDDQFDLGDLEAVQNDAARERQADAAYLRDEPYIVTAEDLKDMTYFKAEYNEQTDPRDDPDEDGRQYRAVITAEPPERCKLMMGWCVTHGRPAYRCHES